MPVIEALKKEIPPALLAPFGAVLLALLWLAGSVMAGKFKSVNADAARLEAGVGASALSLEELRVLRELKQNDAGSYKKALRDRARFKKTVYEAGAALQEEKRLLEKQLEIITAYVEIKEEAGKISLMRGDHSLKDYTFQYSPLRVFGIGKQAMPASARIISKERFAHPQRGSVEEVNGKIYWEPPQAGKDPRSGGLGEFVIFTDSPLVFHGPPPKKELHEAFPHVCAGLTAYTARRLYENTFIGAKILYLKNKKVLP
ncbi:MAG: hypothetical protein A2234_07195 [Elusimicrobia bacterium RIFOXYA2_FULL_58_8]|nr:MAG: hypothetical protein A2234_07195 [Elusimicrobia bacterium RIFOXYA2_FULL_58_8]OGS12666.1 MAG: hypothetical protein A2285_07725 [Elusimicrobia bacterium RIFOXYA12_FULL_57_11]